MDRRSPVERGNTAAGQLWDSILWNRQYRRCLDLLRDNQRCNWCNRLLRLILDPVNNDGHKFRRSQSTTISTLRGRHELLSQMGKLGTITTLELGKTSSSFFFPIALTKFADARTNLI